MITLINILIKIIIIVMKNHDFLKTNTTNSFVVILPLFFGIFPKYTKHTASNIFPAIKILAREQSNSVQMLINNHL